MTDHEKSLTNDQSLELQPRVQIYTDEDDNNLRIKKTAYEMQD